MASNGHNFRTVSLGRWNKLREHRNSVY